MAGRHADCESDSGAGQTVKYCGEASMMRILLPVLMLLSSCGYHLVGHGDGADVIPADVRTLSIVGSGESQQLLVPLRQRLSSESFSLIEHGDSTDEEHHATLRLHIVPVAFNPSAYDAAGVATQYNMVISGSLQVDRKGEIIWQSGPIQRQGDVYVAGDPTSIEASRERLLRDLRKQWLQDAIGRLRSGF
jgi:outer membrane lipopolysaccharide assembly protein LptE/RlpB